MQIKTPYRNGMHNLPSNVSIESPHEIFSLFFDKKILRILAEHTNKYARLHQPYPTQFPGYRQELRVYIGTGWDYIKA